MIINIYPTLNTSANLRRDEFMRIGNGYFSNNLGNLTMASHCSPTLPDLRPINNIMYIIKYHFRGIMLLVLWNVKSGYQAYRVHSISIGTGLLYPKWSNGWGSNWSAR